MFNIFRIVSLFFISSALAHADSIQISLLDLNGEENANMVVDLDHELDQIDGTNLFRRLYARKCIYWLSHKPPKKIQESWDDVSKSIFLLLMKHNIRSIIILLSDDDSDIIIPGRGAPWIVPPSPALGYKTRSGDKASLNINNHKGFLAKNRIL